MSTSWYHHITKTDPITIVCVVFQDAGGRGHRGDARGGGECAASAGGESHLRRLLGLDDVGGLEEQTGWRAGGRGTDLHGLGRSGDPGVGAGFEGYVEDDRVDPVALKEPPASQRG